MSLRPMAKLFLIKDMDFALGKMMVIHLLCDWSVLLIIHTHSYENQLQII